jgi:hypothetical protein
MALSTTTTGSLMTGAEFACPIADESLKNAVLNQDGALGLQSFVIHR